MTKETRLAVTILGILFACFAFMFCSYCLVMGSIEIGGELLRRKILNEMNRDLPKRD